MIKVDRKKGVALFSPDKVTVRAEGPQVVMLIGATSRIEMNTPTAHKVGFALIRLARDCLNEKEGFVCVTINGADLELPPQSARQIGAGLLRKSDTADDFQLRISK